MITSNFYRIGGYRTFTLMWSPHLPTPAASSSSWPGLLAPKKYPCHTALTSVVAVAGMGLALRPTAALLRMGLLLRTLAMALAPLTCS